MENSQSERAGKSGMTNQVTPDIIIYVCKNCIPEGGRLPAQWSEAGMHIRVREIPCSGKIDTHYLFHALEGGVHGVCVLTCSKGECTLTQGNYRAEIRVRTVQRLLKEIGLDPRRAEIFNCPPNQSLDNLIHMINDSAHRFSGVAGILDTVKVNAES
jgi:coenzyme F420-reducing hydrogenase delta subunit